MNWSPSTNGGLFPEPPTGRTMTTPGLVTGNNGRALHSEKIWNAHYFKIHTFLLICILSKTKVSILK